MSDIVFNRNVGALVTLRKLGTALAWTSGGTGDGTAHGGAVIDREEFALSGALPDSALFGVAYDATLGSGASLTIALDIQDSADGVNFSDYSKQAAGTYGTGASGGSVVAGQANFAVNLTSARRYLKANFTPTLTRGGTDTGIATMVGVFGGFDRLAAPV